MRHVHGGDREALLQVAYLDAFHPSWRRDDSGSSNRARGWMTGRASATLLLAAGKLARELLLVARESDERQHLADAPSDLVVRDRADAQSVRDVLEDRQVWKQRVVLEHEADVALVRRQPGHVLAVEENPTGVRHFIAGDHAQRRRLAAARRAEQRQEFARLHLERHLTRSKTSPSRDARSASTRGRRPRRSNRSRRRSSAEQSGDGHRAGRAEQPQRGRSARSRRTR